MTSIRLKLFPFGSSNFDQLENLKLLCPKNTKWQLVLHAEGWIVQLSIFKIFCRPFSSNTALLGASAAQSHAHSRLPFWQSEAHAPPSGIWMVLLSRHGRARDRLLIFQDKLRTMHRTANFWADCRPTPGAKNRWRLRFFLVFSGAPGRLSVRRRRPELTP